MTTEPPSTDDRLRDLARPGVANVVGAIAELRGRPDLVPAALRALAQGDEPLRAMTLVALRLAAPAAELTAGNAWPAVRAALADRSPRVRARAAELLGAGDPEAWALLVAALEDPDPSVAKAAAGAILGLDPAAAAAPLTERLARADVSTRIALFELAARGAPAALAAAAALALHDDPEPRVRMVAVRLLGSVAADWLAPLLAALDDASEEVRLNAVVSLGTAAALVPLGALAPALADPSPRVRASAITLVERRSSDDACAHLLAMIDDADPLVRQAAIRALGVLGCRAATGPVLARLTAEHDAGERVSWIESAGRLGAGLSPPVLAALGDPSPRVRSTAVIACATTDPTDAAMRLTGVLRHDPDPEVRRHAALQLSRARTADATDALLTAVLGDTDSAVRVATASSLPASLSPDQAQEAAAGLADADAGVRAAVVRALARAGAAPLVPRLRALAGSELHVAVQAELEAALRVLDPAAFAEHPLPRAVRELCDPAEQGLASTAWWFDAFHRRTECLVFYMTGALEAIDVDSEVQLWRFTPEGEGLALDGPGDRHAIVSYAVAPAATRFPDGRTVDGFSLVLSSDPLFGTASARFFAPRLTAGDR